MKSNIKGAIFDMDGTLLDSMRVWDALSQRFLGQFGITVTEEDYKAIEGTTQLQGAQYFIDTYPSLTLSAEEVVSGLDQIITKRYTEIAVPKDGVVAFLERLKSKGIKMAVATLTARKHAEKALKDWGLDRFFDFIITIEDVGVSKREPDIYLASAEKLKLKPENCIVFEDAPYGGISAKNAGFYVCGMAEQAYKSEENDLKAISDFFVEHSFDELCGKI